MRTALITGANRGIGLQTARDLGRQGLQVVIAAREHRAAAEAASALAAEGLRALAVELDVTRAESVRAAAQALSRDAVAIDVLVNNAGIYPQGGALEATDSDFTDALEVNTLGPLRCARMWLPGMLERGFGRIVNLSSGYGCFADGLAGPAAYSLSKAALNALTVVLARECRGDVLVAAVDPGWVRTRMGGAQAPRAVGDAAADVAWAVRLEATAPNGVLWRYREVVPW